MKITSLKELAFKTSSPRKFRIFFTLPRAALVFKDKCEVLTFGITAHVLDHGKISWDTSKL